MPAWLPQRIRRSNQTAQRPRRALLAWEYGAGLTHIVNMLAVARHLRAAGVECLAMLHDNPAPQEFDALGVKTVQNFVWPGQRRSYPPLTALSHCVADQIANLGMASATVLAAGLTQYDSVFALFAPDVVLCEHGFAAILAARGRYPVVAFGTGIPVNVDGDFPLFAGASAPSHPVEQVLSALNGGLMISGRPPLTRLVDLIDGMATMPFGPAEFDIYRPFRTQPVLPPFVPGIQEALAGAGGGDEVFAYLHSFVQSDGEIMAALTSLPLPARVFISNLLPAARTRLEAAGVIVEDRPVDVRDILRRSRCVLHHGGPQLTSACLAAGIPQAVIARFGENRLAVRFLSERGLGTGMERADATTDAIAAAVRYCRDDQVLIARCRASAPEFRTWFESDPMRMVAEKAIELASAAIAGSR